MKCPNCNKNISGANKHKVNGVWYHKICPLQKKKVVAKVLNKPFRKMRLRRAEWKVHGKIKVS